MNTVDSSLAMSARAPRTASVQDLVYPNERTLGNITLVLGSIAWLAIVLGTLGIVLLYLLLGFVGYLFAQSALIAYIKGTAVRLSDEQLPDLHHRFLDCCSKLGPVNTIGGLT